jgi:response regulator NasT
MSDPVHPLRIAIAEDEREAREYFQELLNRLGHQTVVAENGKQLLELCRLFNPELVLTDIRMPDMDGIEAVMAINRERPTPAVLVSALHDEELLARAGMHPIMAYLVKPVKQADVETAVHLAMRRFEHLQALNKETASLRQALEDRKRIERAKGVVMRRLQVEEPEAFRRLRTLASNENRKLVEVAQAVLDAELVFKQLEDER